jgi:hypothetical protein
MHGQSLRLTGHLENSIGVGALPFPAPEEEFSGGVGSVSRHVSPRSRRIRELGRFLRREVIAIFEKSRDVGKCILNEMPRRF